MPEIRKRLTRALFGLVLLEASLTFPVAPGHAAEQAQEAAPVGAPALPDTETRHTITLDGRQLDYVARAGTLTVPEEGESGLRGRMFYVAYTMAAQEPGRPLTFVFNGGPGAAAAYLHLGAMGPRRVDFDPDGRVPTENHPLVDNEDTWLAFTDLVFVDPIGTGYSRSVGAAGGDNKGNQGGDEASFWETGKDLETLGAFIRLYLSRNQRWLSPTVIAGESYGGFRAAALAEQLQSDFGISVDGVIMISPALELDLLSQDRFRLMPWIARVPSYAAAALHHGKVRLDGGAPPQEAEFLQSVERFSVQELLPDLVLGSSLDETARTRLISKLAGYIGLPEEMVARYRARVPPEVFGARLLRDQGRIVSLYDGSISYPAPNPTGRRYRDPRLARISAALVAAFNHHARTSLGIQTDLPYEILNHRVIAGWKWQQSSSREGPPGAADELEKAMKDVDGLRALLVHGLYDLVTPYYGSVYLLNQLDLAPDLRSRLTFRTYQGGHMFYSRTGSRHAFEEDARRLYDEIGKATR